MSENDPRVKSMNASIEARLANWVSDNSHLAEVAGHERAQRDYMGKHQPEGGRWGAPCLGEHDAPTPWPCKGMQQFDSSLAYMN